MDGMRLLPEDSDVSQLRPSAATDLISDDDRSVAADSWSIKSEYGSTLDDEQRHADATEALNYRAEYSSDKDEQDGEGVSSMLGFQSYWDAAYADELANFREHGHTGEVWFGGDVMENVVSWTKGLCMDISKGHLPNHVADADSEPVGQHEKEMSGWSVLDIGTGNGLLLQELAKQGWARGPKDHSLLILINYGVRFSDLTGTDYSEGAVDLARSLADRDGFASLKFLVDDILETKLDKRFLLVMDKGTLDAIGLHPDSPIKRLMYWDSVSRLVAPGGLLVITSCNSTKDELVEEVDTLNRRRHAACQAPGAAGGQEASVDPPPFRYLDHIRTYPTFTFGGSVGSRVATVAFLRN
ncbi:putative peptidyl-prolyl cis-trans isomerase FKBP19, chloroplastic-like isoform X1 [Capsicum annuum]|uniref:EEF1A lysine methyltransferase 2 isoform X3 n=1 Tax=Capsicum annuum TaxID=4072 RepID=UPI001FB13A17|nr:EEF1A lysine methyltransferase 2 isoform X3 [Capsicum annuum]KAF3646925.1 putative peptidyl-prolyl cis-trans isomerase FKBP19, chloroplastic-like isoform X1 [Capsicum annuum]